MDPTILLSVMLVIGVVCFVVSVWERNLVTTAILWMMLGLSIRWHVESFIPYGNARLELPVYAAVVLLLFIVPGVAIIRRVSWGWWIAVIISGILGFIVPCCFVLLAAMDGCGAGATFLIPFTFIHFILYFPCFIALAVNNPRTWRGRTPAASSEQTEIG